MSLSKKGRAVHADGVDPAVARRVQADDVAWFEARPGAPMRFRPAVRGEAPALVLEPADRWAQITRLASGDFLYVFNPHHPRDLGIRVDDDGAVLGVEESALRLLRSILAGTDHAN